MDGLTLLLEATAAGLTVRVDGERLVIRGLRSADAVARELLAHKVDVLGALHPLSGWPADCPYPHWWPEVAGVFPSGTFLKSRRQVCGGCGFGVSVLWVDGQGRQRWSCPRCGLGTPPEDNEKGSG